MTRAKIVDAAALLFGINGYAATPLLAIAEEAGVSIQSVHAAGPKASLLLQAFEKSFAGDVTDPHADRTALAEIMAEPDPAVALDRYVAFIVAANERSARVWHALHLAADAVVRVGETVGVLEARRRADLRRTASWLISIEHIPPRDFEVAADTLGFLTSPDSYLWFVVSSRWPVPRYEAWLRDGIERMVLRRTPATDAEGPGRG